MIRRRLPPWMALAAILVATAAARPGESSDGMGPEPFPVDLDWSRSKLWDDGQAEVAHYDSRREVYGVERAFETTMITVKEDLDRSIAVKADPPYEGRQLLTVLKLNLMAHIPTENYPYDYMTSVFVSREDPRILVKLATSSQEWCGTTFKEVVAWDGSPRLHFHSYFDKQADGETPLDLASGALLEEQLMLVMRAARLAPAATHRFRLYDSLVTITAPAPRSREMIASLLGQERVVTPAGEFLTRRIEVRPAAEGRGPAFSFWIDEAPGRALVKMLSSDGRSHTLKSVSRRKYWVRQPAQP